MPKYMVFRTVGELSEEDIRAAVATGTEVAEQMPQIRWIRSYYSTEEGKLYCEYEAPSIELLYEYSRRLGQPIDHVTVVRDLEPSMFW
jgi:Protein of unknown function (DUF4242)